MRSALLNALSHDLRTPIASVKAAVTSLRSKEVAWSEDDKDELLTHAETALDRLTELVTNLLDLSRVQAGVIQVVPVPVALEDVVSQAVDHVAVAGIPGQERSTIVVDVPSLPEALADAGLLERVVANLLENALRYSPPAEPVRISASGYGDTLELRVIDRGPGISARDREAVFEPFQRRDDHAGGTNAGVGLGLAISRAFVEAMNGTLTLDDTPGGGLTAVVALNRDPGSAPMKSSAGAALLGEAGT
jgi:two-component system sensor histidine kinase KdpD